VLLPPLGGLICERLGWRAVFWSMVRATTTTR
jgi:predicted MFS family arabinose efflux permease